MTQVKSASECSALIPTIDLAKLSFADWVAIAHSWNSDAKWAFYRWRDSGGIPSNLTLEDWEAIADVIGWSGNWAYKQFNERRTNKDLA